MPGRLTSPRNSALAGVLIGALAGVLTAGAPCAQPPGTPQDPARQNPAVPSPNPASPNPQDPVRPDLAIDPDVQRLVGRRIKQVRIVRSDGQRLQALPDEAADGLLRTMQTRAGQPLQMRDVSTDVYNLWSERRLKVSCVGVQEGEEVLITFRIVREDQVYERVEFKGMRHFERSTAEELLGIYHDRQITDSEAVAMRNVLLARYRRDGYAFCSVELDRGTQQAAPAQTSSGKPVLTFRVDEGIAVGVARVVFRGNRSFAVWPDLGLFGGSDYLARDSKISSDPDNGFLSDVPYSEEIVEEDLDKLRLFYRSKGFLDAVVELSDVRFSADQTSVDLEFTVVEGPRYRIRSCRIQHYRDQTGVELAPGEARYSAAEVERELQIQPGEFYDQERIERDMLRVQDFYGKRGHPPDHGPFRVRGADAFQILGRWPGQYYTEDHQVDLVYRVVEGTPKTLRDVLIRGNTYTRDKVIRRRVQLNPGDVLDVTELERSSRYLYNTRYFTNQMTLQGPRYELVPVPDHPDQLDLQIEVEEGETGEFRWGVGIGTDSGFQASLQFNKRNFDLFNLPSTASPVQMFDEILSSRAFHGGGQQIDMFLAPGTELTQFSVGFTEPDLFGDHQDTIGLRLNGRRRIRQEREGYENDTLGLDVGLFRNFTEEFSIGLSFRQESIEISDLAPDATSLAWASEGQTELRGLRASVRYRDLDDPRVPTKGIDLNASIEQAGGFLGAEVDFYKASVALNGYLPLWENVRGHRHVLRLEGTVGFSHAFDDSNEVFITERFYLGGQNLRGFDRRGAGPSQFGRPYGGEALVTATAEYIMPLIPMRSDQDGRERMLLRGLVFSDFGLLGLSYDDPTFQEPRLSVGFGFRLDIPVLEIPIAIDFGYPILYEETDDRRVVWFSISR